MTATTRRASCFTVIECMIVIAILGLLAAVAIPQFTATDDEDRAKAMVCNLATLRTAIDHYWTQHDDFPGPSAAAFADQLLNFSDKQGAVGEGEAFEFGPYLPGDVIPVNPLNEANDVVIVDAMPSSPDGRSAWIYCNLTGEIRSNATGKTVDGVEYFDL